MKVIVNQVDEAVFVKVVGRLDTMTASEFSKEVAGYYPHKSVRMVIDCTDLEYISSSGLRAFLAIYKALSANGGALELINLQRSVMEVFTITGFNKFLTIK